MFVHLECFFRGDLNIQIFRDSLAKDENLKLSLEVLGNVQHFFFSFFLPLENFFIILLFCCFSFSLFSPRRIMNA